MQARTFASLSAVALWCAATCAHAQTFQNGSFEQHTATGALGSGSMAITGWTTQVGNGAGANVYEASTATGQTWVPPAENGTYVVDLDGSQNANDAAFLGDGSALTPKRDSITQTFTLAPGRYNLSFWINNEVGNSKGGTSGALVLLSGVASGGLNFAEYTVTNPANATAATSTWKNYTDTFTVTNATAPITLTFADDNNSALANYTSSSNISIDNVSINTVPEPSTWAMLGLGVAGAGVMAARRRWMLA